MLSACGRVVFALAIVALGLENWFCAHMASHGMGARYSVIPVLPFLPAIPWLADLFGGLFAVLGAGLLWERTRRPAALLLGALLLVCVAVLEAPKSAASIGNVSLRTGLFEPLAMGCLAWLMLDGGAAPGWLLRVARYLLAASLIVFGVDHFLVLRGIAALIPRWIPLHVFWTGFFGAAFVAGGLSIGFRVWERAGAFCLGLMFLIWVVTLHFPLAVGLINLPGDREAASIWSSLFIAMAMWGGCWAIARRDMISSPHERHTP